MPHSSGDLRILASRLRAAGLHGALRAVLDGPIEVTRQLYALLGPLPPDVEGAPAGVGARAEHEPERDGPPRSTRYVLGDPLGAGGAGEVFGAHDRLLRREVALKALRASAQVDPEGRRSFEYEARIAGGLSHPGILPIHDLGRLPDGRWFYTMPRLAGRSLAEVLDGLRAGDAELGVRFPLRRLMEIFHRVCLTVAYAHDQGVMHRDLKPANLMLGAYGEVYVIDWGLAQSNGHRPDEPGSTAAPGAFMGTLAYASPEQLDGEPDEVTRATDVWALGVTLFELLTLQRPFVGERPIELMYAIVGEPLPDPRARQTVERPVPEPLAELCRTALDRDHRGRIAARALADGVGAWLDGVEQRARRRARAAELTARAEAAAEAWRVDRAQIERDRRALSARTHALGPRAPAGERRALWAERQRLEEHALRVEGHFGRAVHAADAALDEWPTAEGRALLAGLHWQRARHAERAREPTTALFFRELAARHDDGALADALASIARLGVDAPGEVTVVRQVPEGPLLRDVPLTRGAELGPLPAGSYVVECAAPGHMPVRLPLRLEGGDARQVVIRPPRAFDGHAGYVWIPGGRYAIGGDELAPMGLPAQHVEVSGFALGRHPVTMAAYCRFLDALAAQDGVDAARRRAPRSIDGSVCYLVVDAESGRFSVPEVDADGDAWSPDWPVLAVDLGDARAYCAWLTGEAGVEHRLPTEIEWEVAARGADARLYPWGDGFDASLCHMSQSVDGPPVPVPVGSYPHDRSPFGAMDMAGLAIEWTATAAPGGDQIQRGAAATSPASWCRAGARRVQRPDWPAPQFGFRVVRAVPDGRVEGLD